MIAKKWVLFCVFLVSVTVAAVDFIYWRASDHEAATREKISVFADQCEDMALDFNAAHTGPVRARAYEQNLILLKAHPLTGAAQCTQVRGRCEVGYAVTGDTSSS